MGNPTGATRGKADWAVPAYVRWSPLLVLPLSGTYVASTFWQFLPMDGSWLGLALELLAAVLTGARAVHRKSERAVWGLACAALTSWMIGSIILFFTSLAGIALPVPSIADLFWLAFYPLMVAALVIRIRRRVLRRLQSGFVLDGLIAGLGASALVISFIVGPLLGNLTGSTAQIVTNAAYPIGDQLLLGMAVAVLAVSGRIRLSRTWIALILAQLLYMTSLAYVAALLVYQVLR